MIWTDTEVTRLLDMNKQGLSAGVIGQRLGKTRSAILGKLHRMGVAKRMPTGDSLRRKRSPRPKVSSWGRGNPGEAAGRPAVASPEPPFTPPRDGLNLSAAALAVEALRPSSCRWPIGEVKSPGFHFCGGVRVDASAYCEAHQHKARMRRSG